MQNPFAEKIIQKIEDRETSGEEFRRLIRQFVDSLSDCLKKEADESFAGLAPLMASRNLSRASLIATLCGSMVESGCDPRFATPYLTTGLTRALKAIMPMVDKLERKVRPRLETAESPEQRSAWIASAVRQLSVRLPESAAALKSFERFMRPALTMYSKDLANRQKGLPEFWDYASRMESWFPDAEKLLRLMTVLEKEPIIAIDVASQKGFVGRFGGAINNSQLIILLMDTFARQYVFPKPLISHDMGLCAHGEGPQQVGDKVQGAWNLYDHRALDSRLKLPDPKDLKANKFWLWNERKPSEIPAIDGFRVILIGPPSYPREWEFEREFRYLKAGIKVDSELSRTDLRDWLERINDRNLALKKAGAQPLAS